MSWGVVNNKNGRFVECFSKLINTSHNDSRSNGAFKNDRVKLAISIDKAQNI